MKSARLYLIDSMFSLMVHGVESPLTMLPRTPTRTQPGAAAHADDDGDLPIPTGDSESFCLEKYLQDFIVANWDKTPLENARPLRGGRGKGSRIRYGRGRYPGPRPFEGDWIVIELKKGRNSTR